MLHNKQKHYLCKQIVIITNGFNSLSWLSVPLPGNSLERHYKYKTKKRTANVLGQCTYVRTSIVYINIYSMQNVFWARDQPLVVYSFLECEASLSPAFSLYLCLHLYLHVCVVFSRLLHIIEIERIRTHTNTFARIAIITITILCMYQKKKCILIVIERARKKN